MFFRNFRKKKEGATLGESRAGLRARHDYLALEFGVLDGPGQFDRGPSVGDAVAAARQDFLVDDRVQVIKPGSEVEALVFVQKRTLTFALLDGQSPVNQGGLKFHGARHHFRRPFLDLEPFTRSIDPHHQIQEMDPDVGDQSAGTFRVTLPGVLVPLSAGRAVVQLDLVDVGALDHLTHPFRLGVVPHLQDRPNATAGTLLVRFELVEVTRLDDERLLADDVAPVIEAHPAVRVVQIVRTADRQVVDAAVAVLQLAQLAVEPFRLGVVLGRAEAVAIEHANRAVRVEDGDQVTVERLDGLEVARRNVARHAGHSETLARRVRVSHGAPRWWVVDCASRSVQVGTLVAVFCCFVKSP